MIRTRAARSVNDTFGPLKLGRMDERRQQIEDHKGRFARKTLSPMSPD
jgi:hypothetical protein